MKVLSIPAVVFFVRFWLFSQFYCCFVVYFRLLVFGFSVVILGNSSLAIFRYSYCETLLFHSIRPLKIL